MIEVVPTNDPPAKPKFLTLARTLLYLNSSLLHHSFPEKCEGLFCIWQCQAGGEGICTWAVQGASRGVDGGQNIIPHTHLQIGRSLSSKNSSTQPRASGILGGKASKGPWRACGERWGSPRQNRHRPSIGLTVL